MDSTREVIANGPGYSGAYQGRYADARLSDATGCLHCALLAKNLSHYHDVLALRIADQPPAVAWFSHIGLDYVRDRRPTYLHWSITTGVPVLAKLEVNARDALDGQPHTYVWRMVDRYANGYESGIDFNGQSDIFQLGVWVD